MCSIIKGELEWNYIVVQIAMRHVTYMENVVVFLDLVVVEALSMDDC
jgi:hypothetical protein